ncbi:MAG: hypothetical protein K2Q20_09440 [Phycisphaerales bacterium]|nr:hypothetical protein [Phycisphaerales bacterium]
MSRHDKPSTNFKLPADYRAQSLLEAMDRTYMLADTFESFVADHTVLEDYPRLKDQARAVALRMSELYDALRQTAEHVHDDGLRLSEAELMDLLDRVKPPPLPPSDAKTQRP